MPARLTYSEIADREGVTVATVRTYATTAYPAHRRLKMYKPNTRNHWTTEAHYQAFLNANMAKAA